MMREYAAVCLEGHRSYHRLELVDWTGQVLVRCPTCGQPSRIEPLAEYEYTCNACHEEVWRPLGELLTHRREQHLVRESEPLRGKKRPLRRGEL